MIIYDKSKYKDIPFTDDYISSIEKENEVQCLFGGMFSSKVYGIDNAFSDFDFYLVYKNGFFNANKRVFDSKTIGDILLLNYEEIIDSKNRSHNERYPTILYRDKCNNANINNFNSSDFVTTQKFFEILYSDYIWDSGFLGENIDYIISNISVLDVFDYYYSRGYGNLKNHLKSGETDAVRILRTFLNIACLKWLINEMTIPNMDIHFMIDKFAPQSIGEYLNKILSAVKNMQGQISPEMHSFGDGKDNLFEHCSFIADDIKTIKVKPNLKVAVDKLFIEYAEKELYEIGEYVRENQDYLKTVKLSKGKDAFYFRCKNEK